MSEVVGPKASQSQTVQVQQEQVQGRWRAQLLQKSWRQPQSSLVLHHTQVENMAAVRRPKMWHRSEYFNANIVNISIRMASLNHVAYFLTSASSDCQAGDGKYYKGEVNKTGSGRDCQVWAEQKPHKHKHKDVGENNFCRNPDNHDAVWCYTTDKKKRWEECNVPKC